LVRFCIVPDESERVTTVIFLDGRALPPLSVAIAGSDQLVILPAKILARVAAERFSVDASLSWYWIATPSR
jgi:hypothetical protein